MVKPLMLNYREEYKGSESEAHDVMMRSGSHDREHVEHKDSHLGHVDVNSAHFHRRPSDSAHGRAHRNK